MNTQEILLYNSLLGLHLLNKQEKKRVLHDLLGIQSQFASYAQMSLFLRCTDYSEDSFGNGTAKIWSHRGTLHLVNEEEVPLHLAAAGICREFEDGAWQISQRDCEQWASFIVDEVGRGNTTRDGLKEACRKAGISEALLERVFYGWGGLIREMILRGMIVGTAGNKKEYKIPEIDTAQSFSRDEARVKMLRTYFEHYGPATINDCKYFFGNRKKPEFDRLMEIIQPELNEIVIDGVKYYHKNPLVTDAILPDCVLIPGFDQLILGYKDRDRMIDKKHLKKLTNISGIVCPSILIRGRLRAAWRMEKGRLTVIPFEHLYKKDQAVVSRTVRKTFGNKMVVHFGDVLE